MIKKNSITHKAIHLVSELHPTKNSLTAKEITYASNKKVWWLCKNGHEWMTSPGNRYRGTGCPDCSGKKVSANNNLAVKRPDLLDEWHPTKNGSLLPHQVSARGKTYIWWICKMKHEWQATTGNRFMGTGCPDCKGRKASNVYNLAIKFPDLLTLWDFEKNGKITPYQVTPGSQKKVSWICKNGHGFNAVISAMTKGQKCPFCLGRKASKTNNLAFNQPHLINEWDFKKNISAPTNFTTGSKSKVWWKCRWGHEWEAVIFSRTKGHGCPKCNFRSSKLEVRIYCELKYIFPDTLWQSKIDKREVDVFIQNYAIAFEIDGWYWHKDRIDADKSKAQLLKNKNIRLIRIVDQRAPIPENQDILLFRNGENEYDVIVRILNFLMENCNFSQEDLHKIKNYLKNSEYKNVQEYNSIMSSLPGPLKQNSVASNPSLVAEWNYQRNKLSPMQFSCGSAEKVWWLCDNSHEWYASIGSRSAGNKCPYCSGKKPSATNNLLAINPELAAEFHISKNQPLTPDKITAKSNKKVWWLCKYGHEWQATVCNRNSGTKCPDCTGKLLSTNHNLAIKYPELIAQWHPEKNAPLTPYDVTPKSSKKVWWICIDGHEWVTSVEKRTRGRGCHICTGQHHLVKKYMVN